jgi:signal transduction histidine kinase
MLDVPVERLVGAPPPLRLGPPGTPVEHESPGHRVEAVPTRLEGTDETVVALRDVSRQRALDEAKDLFLSTTGHELRTPLTAIKGYVRILQRRWDVMSEQQRLQAIATISERTDALVELTDHLLAGAASGRRDPARIREFDLGQALRSAVAPYEHVSPGHTVVLDVPPQLPPAMGDVNALGHVVGQIVGNAVKYSPAGGEVLVRARSDDACLQVEVADRGVGIPPGREEDVFAPFVQAAEVNTREFGGVGLGLYIVRQLVEAQGGTVAAANREGGGAVVTFRLPRAVPRPGHGEADLVPGSARTPDDALTPEDSQAG